MRTRFTIHDVVASDVTIGHVELDVEYSTSEFLTLVDNYPALVEALVAALKVHVSRATAPAAN